MSEFVSDIAFTDAVKSEQAQRGSREGYQKMAEKKDWAVEINDELAQFIGQRNSFYLATVSADGQPYIQHRGGPKGFLKVIDNKTLGFAEFSGNRQYITLGNLSENNKAYIFLMDYANTRRVKIWGTARAVETDADLLSQLTMPGYKARIERAILFTITAWDVNCPQHIPQMYDLETVEQATEKLTGRVHELEERIAQLESGRPNS